MKYKVILCVSLGFILAASLISGLRADEFKKEELKKWQDVFMDVVIEG